MARLALSQSGEEHAPAILFLHASPLSSRMWEPQLAGLSAFHCLAHDLPGHGRSAALGMLPLDELAAELALLISRHAVGGRAHVVGLSYGGVVAQALLANAPNCVNRVLLSGTSARLGAVMSAVLRIYLKLNQPLLNMLRADQLARLLSLQFGIPPAYLHQLSAEMKRVDPAVMVAIIQQSYTSIPTQGNLSNDTLIAVGGRETPFARIMAHRLVRSITGAQGILLPKLGHLWNLEEPELFNRIAGAWFNQGILPQDIGYRTLRPD